MIVQDESKLKQYILTTYDQSEIFAEYLEISDSDINYCIENTSNKINNPLRRDENPSLGFKTVIDRETGEVKIKMYDFADAYYRGDCFDLVRIILSKKYGSKGLNFIIICKDIINTMQNHKAKVNSNKSVKTITSKVCSDITVEIRPWNKYDINFWKEQGLYYSEIKNNVNCVLRAFYNDILIYTNRPDDPCYHYITGVYQNHTLRKLYYPKRNKKDKRGRFATNNSFYALECLPDLRVADILLITKSYKDKLLLKKILKEITIKHTIEVTNFTSETFTLSTALASALFKTYEHIIVNTDFDKAGISALHIRKKYPINYYFITNGKYGTVDYGGKDISDIVRNKDYAYAKDLVQKAYNDFVQNYLNNSNDNDEYS